MQVSSIHRNWLKFAHYGTLIVCFFWLSITVLLYWHAPSFHVEQLYDCRWNLSYLLFSAVFGNFWVKNPSTLLFSATYIFTLYSVVYCFLALLIYGIDSILIFLHTYSEIIDFSNYVKLSVSMVALSVFGIFLSVFHFYKLQKVAWEQESKKQIVEQRKIQIFSIANAILAIFTVYIALELSPLKTWFIRSYVVREFACSLLILSLSMVQLLSFFYLNSVIMKVLVFLNLCQFIQEIQMGIFSFYTIFYLKQVAGAMNMENQLFHQILVAISVMVHFYRTILCVWTIYLFAPHVFEKTLNPRIVRTVDQVMENAQERLAQQERQDNRWILIYSTASLTIAISHVLIISAYLIFGSMSEELFASTGISLVLAALLFGSISWYKRSKYRIAMISTLYFALNLIVMSLLFILNFLHERFFERNFIPKENVDFYLHLLDITSALVTFVVVLRIVSFGFNLLLKTTTLHAQPQKVTFMVTVLRWIALLTLLLAGIEFLMFVLVHYISRLDVNGHAHLTDLTSSIQDWFLLAAQGILIYWACKHERYQAVIKLLIFELTTVAVTSLDLLSQQTDLVQMMIKLIFKPDLLLQVSADAKLFDANQYFMVLVLHFIQVLQWFLSIFALGVCLYIADNLVIDESNSTNDFHEISSLASEDDGLAHPDQPLASNRIAWSSNISPEIQISFQNEVFQQDEFNDPISIQNVPKY